MNVMLSNTVSLDIDRVCDALRVNLRCCTGEDRVYSDVPMYDGKVSLVAYSKRGTVSVQNLVILIAVRARLMYSIALACQLLTVASLMFEWHTTL